MRLLRNETRLETGRIEAFSDGVFAIAITLLVLEIGVPHLDEGQTMFDALGGLAPSLFGYVFGFWIIGIYWANHHYVFSLYRRSNHFFALLNVIFLMTISFLPFPTAVLAEYIADPAHRDSVIVFYLAAVTLPALTWALVWLYARRARLIDERLAPRFVRFLSWQYVGSVAGFVTIVLIGLLNSAVALALAVGLSLLYVIPPREPEYVEAPAT